MCTIPNLPLIGENIIIFSAHIWKNTQYLILLIQIFGKDFVIKTTAKCWSGTTFGHFIMIFMD